MKRRFMLLSLLLLATACQRNSYSTFSNKYRVFFSCETYVAPFNQLTTPGRFLSVRKTEGKLYWVDSDGNSDNIELSAKQNGSYVMGLAGLIIGTPTFNNDDMSIWAYDLGCPECDGPNTRLKFDLQGVATCPKCAGTWNLNANGSPINSDGKQNRPLYRYPTSFNNGILTVSN